MAPTQSTPIFYRRCLFYKDAFVAYKAEAIEQNRALLSDPNDPIIIRLIALREGLCNMIDGGKSASSKVSIFFGRISIQRIKEELTREPKLELRVKSHGKVVRFTL